MQAINQQGESTNASQQQNVQNGPRETVDDRNGYISHPAKGKIPTYIFEVGIV